MHLTPNLILQTTQYLQSKGFTNVHIGIVLGTGLGAMVHKIKNPIIIPYTDIPNFATATVEFHKGNLIYGSIGNKNIVAMQGRFHYYEGYSMQQITFPIRVIKALGAQHLFLSNAAGGINTNFKKGNLILIDDHLNFLPDNPLRGISNPALGERFVDMCTPYCPLLGSALLQTAAAQNVILHTGTYAAVMGPNLETKAEYRWLKSTGADVVGMSTVPEVIVANQVGLPCAAISVVTDECDADHLKPVNIADIIAVAGRADEVLSHLIEQTIVNL